MQKNGYHMYYVCLVCPDPPASKIRAYQEWMYHHFGCRAAMKSPPHITLVPPFWWPEEKEAALREVLAEFRLEQPAINISWNGFGHFGKRVLYIQVDDHPDLCRLESSLSQHLNRNLVGLVSAKRQNFHPHISLATRDMSPAAFQNAWEYFSRKECKGSFEITGISLMKLEPGQWKIISVFPFG